MKNNITWQEEKNIQNFGFTLKDCGDAQILRVFVEDQPEGQVGIALCLIDKGEHGEFVTWSINKFNGDDPRDFYATTGHYLMIEDGDYLTAKRLVRQDFRDRVKDKIKPWFDSYTKTSPCFSRERTVGSK